MTEETIKITCKNCHQPKQNDTIYVKVKLPKEISIVIGLIFIAFAIGLWFIPEQSIKFLNIILLIYKWAVTIGVPLLVGRLLHSTFIGTEGDILEQRAEYFPNIYPGSLEK